MATSPSILSSSADPAGPILASVMGPTASGKTALAESLADKIDAVLINADAFQVYRGLDIGTAKSPRKAEYRLIDVADPAEQFGLGQWLRLVHRELGELYDQGRNVVIVGGTGLYIRALTEGYDRIHAAPPPELRSHLSMVWKQEGLEGLKARLAAFPPERYADIDLQNPIRVIRRIEQLAGSDPEQLPTVPPFRRFKFGLNPPKVDDLSKISQRFDDMIAEGWIAETAGLLKIGYRSENPGFLAHGYRRICLHLAGQVTFEDLRTLTIAEIVRYAKRQRTWMRKEPNLCVLEGKPEDLLDKVMSNLFA